LAGEAHTYVTFRNCSTNIIWFHIQYSYLQSQIHMYKWQSISVCWCGWSGDKKGCGPVKILLQQSPNVLTMTVLQQTFGMAGLICKFCF